MKKEKIREKLKQYKDLAAQKGAILNVNEHDFIDDDHLDCVWYGGDIGNIVYKSVIFDICVHGDVCLFGYYNGQEIYYNNKSNTGAIGTDLYYQIPDDKTLHQLSIPDWQKETDDHLEWGNNNWVEIFFGNSNSSDVANDDNVLEAVGEALEFIEELYQTYLDVVGEEKKCPFCENGYCNISPDDNPCDGSAYAQNECAYRTPVTMDESKKTFRFTYSVEGYVEIEVAADSEEEARKIALQKSSEINCGELHDVDWNEIECEEG